MAAFILSVLLSFIPAFFYAMVLYWLDRYEKEPLMLIGGAFAWGAFVATIGAIIFGVVLERGIFLLTGSEELTNVAGAVLVAPLVEESLKGMAVLLLFAIFHHEFDSVLDGIVYAGIIGLGFAATENVLYLFFGGYEESGWGGLFLLFFIRVILGAWGHAVYTAFIGIGVAMARLNRNPAIKLFAPIAGWGLAVFAHMLHNGLAVFLGSTLGLGGLVALLLVDWTSWALMFGIVLWAISRERRWIAHYLREEVQMGLITRQQYQVAQSTWAQTMARLKALVRGRRRTTRIFYQLCAELAQKKHQLAMFGEERGNSEAIQRLRSQIAQMAPHVPAHA
jgi:RsiW-degrading membrane proteinase PrsW (M82 family)